MIKQQGFSLIEALISLVILSLGLVGVAAMQLKALQSATIGYQHSVVTLAAVDAQERLWAELPGEVNCNEINPKKENGVEDQWRMLWSRDEPSNPLRNMNWQDSDIQGPDINCEFTITIGLSGGYGGIEADDFTYSFRLPKLL